MIKVSIIEDDATFTELVAWALAKNKGIKVVGKHLNAEEALREIPRQRPDVVLMDISLPGMNGIECVLRLKAIEPKLEARILFLTGDPNDDLVFEALKAGADGYLTKDEILQDLWRPVKAVSEGGGAMSPKIARRVMARFQDRLATKESSGDALLSAREREVLVLLADGKMYKEIADALGISINTVRKHLQAIYGKLDVRTRHDATQYYQRQQDVRRT